MLYKGHKQKWKQQQQDTMLMILKDWFRFYQLYLNINRLSGCSVNACDFLHCAVKTRQFFFIAKVKPKFRLKLIYAVCFKRGICAIASMMNAVLALATFLTFFFLMQIEIIYNEGHTNKVEERVNNRLLFRHSSSISTANPLPSS